MVPRKQLQVKVMGKDGKETVFHVRRDSIQPWVVYFENGGILPYLLRKMMRNKA